MNKHNKLNIFIKYSNYYCYFIYLLIFFFHYIFSFFFISIFFSTCQVSIIRSFVNCRASSSFSSFLVFLVFLFFVVGPQPRPSMSSVRCRTSTPMLKALPDRMSENRIPDGMWDNKPNKMVENMSINIREYSSYNHRNTK